MFLAALIWAASLAADAEAYRFENGKWFDGASFVEKTMYAKNGMFVAEAPEGEVTAIDLKGGYVLPPFGEAHNHNVDAGAAEMIARYLREGIFYVKNPNSLPSDRTTLGENDTINTPRSIDVIFANGGLTTSDGHPIQIAQRLIDNGYWDASDGEGGFYHTLDDVTELEAKWPRIIADKPDFIKTYLLYSEEFEKRRDDAEFNYWKGLDPELLPAIVERAHADGLRVSTHVETATDFRNALDAGVDEINHMPGFRPQEGYALSIYEISDADAELAAEKGVVVVTTLAGVHSQEVRDLHKRNLETLKEHGVKLAIGSDSHNQTSTIEANYLRRLEVFSNAELLRLWSTETAQAIFPERKLGRLEEGYEASFIVLEGDPIADFSNTRRIELRVKQGVVLE